MPSNIEIKAKIASKKRTEDLHEKLVELCGPSVEVMRQEDTFFVARNGRLKLREFHGNSVGRDAELIHYKRSNEEGPKLSDYVKVSIPSGESAKLKEALTRAQGTIGSVLKKRTLYIYKQDGISTRVHMDEVDGLGDFIEFEVCLSDGQTAEDGTKIADALMAKLEIAKSDLLKGAYMDMLCQQTKL